MTGGWIVPLPRISYRAVVARPPVPRTILSEKGRETLRQMVQHEDDLRNQRLGYLLTLNGFLFAALAFAWKAQHSRSLVVVLAAMGILVAWSSFVSMKRSDIAIRNLRDRAWTFDKGPLGGTGPRELADLQSIPVAFSSDEIGAGIARRKEWTWERIQQPWHALPLILLAAWAAILGFAFAYLSW